MPNPYRKHSPRRRDSRRSQNWKLKAASESVCKNCGQQHTPHRVCRHCGFYDGKLVVAKKEKKSKKKQAEGGDESK